MPLNRTPPSSPKINNCIKTNSDLSSKTTRSRTRSRKRTQDEDLSNSMTEIRKMLTELKEEQNLKLDALQGIINDIRKQNDGLIDSIEHLSNENKDLKLQLNNMDKERKSNLEYIQVLENKIETLEKTQNLSSIEVKNIPPQQRESKDDLLKVITKLGTTLNLPIHSYDIRDIYRINTKTEENKPIIVDFTSIITKDSVIEHSKKFNNQHKENKLNTTHLHINGPSKNIYISERLTPKTRRLFFLARDFANSYEYKYCWTAGGKVYLRKKDGERALRINLEADLEKLKGELRM